MSDKNGSFVFSLGDNNERTYKGTKMRPRDGLLLAMDLAKAVSEVFTEFDDNDEQLKDMSLSTIAKMISKLDTNVCIGFAERALKSTIVEAKEDAQQKLYVLSRPDVLDEWFSMYPGDMILFYIKVVWENVSPFLPTALKEANLDKYLQNHIATCLPTTKLM